MVLLIGPLLLSLPGVQNRIVNRIAQNLSEKIGGDLQIESLELKYDGQLGLSGIQVKDYKDNPLLEIDQIETSITEINKLINGELDFGQLVLNGLNLEVNKYQNDSINSLEILLNDIKLKQESQRDFKLKTQFILLNDAQISYQDMAQPSNNYSMDSLYVLLHDVDIQSDDVHATLTNIQWRSNQYQDSHQNSISGVLAFTDGKDLAINNLSIDYEKSKISGDLSIHNLQGLINQLGSESIINVHFENAILYPGRLGLHQYFSSDYSLNCSAQIKGSANNINISELFLNNDQFDFFGNIQLNDVFTSALKLKADINRFNAQIGAFKGISFPIQKELNKIAIHSLNLHGNMALEDQKMILDIHGNTNLGGVNIQGDLGRGLIQQKKGNKSTDLILGLQEFDLHKALKIDNRLQLNGQIIVNSSQLFVDDLLTLQWELKEFSSLYKNSFIDSIVSKGSIKNNEVVFDLDMDAPFLKHQGKYQIGFKQGKKELHIDNQLSLQNENNLLAIPNWERGSFQGVINAKLTGTNWENLIGSILFDELNVRNKNQQIPINQVLIVSQTMDEIRSISLIGDQQIRGNVSGQYQYKQLWNVLKQSIYKSLGYTTTANQSTNQEFEFDLFLGQQLMSSLLPNVFQSDDIEIMGQLSNQKNLFDLQLNSNRITYQNLKYEKLKLFLKLQNFQHNNHFSFSSFQRNEFQLLKTSLQGNGKSGDLKYVLNFVGKNQNEGQIKFNQFQNEQMLVLNFLDSNITYNGIDWNIPAITDDQQQITYDVPENKLSIKSFVVEGPEKSISLTGFHSDKENLMFGLQVINASLENIIQPSPDFAFRGRADVFVDYSTIRANDKLIFNANIEDFVLNNQYLGKTTFKIQQTSFEDFLDIDFKIINSGLTQLEANGELWLDDAPRIDLDIDFNNFDISFLNRITDPSVNQIRGTVLGNVRLDGPLKNLQHNGHLVLSNGGVSIPFLNIDYSSDQVDVILSDQAFIFNNGQYFDSTYGTSMFLEGRIFHQDFKNWQLDLDARSDRMLLVNKEEQEDAIFTGLGYLKGSAHIEGLTRSLFIEISGQTQVGTSIRIPQLIDTDALLDTSFISFVDRNEVSDNSIAINELLQPQTIRGITLDFNLDITDQAEIEIITEPQFGSFLSGRGTGRMQLEIDTNGKFNMLGEYTVSEGFYNFKYLGLIDKDFEVLSGSNIIWDGDPSQAQMSIDAIYQVPGGANPSVLLETPSFSKKIPTNVMIEIQGNIQRPDDPVFAIDFPNASGVVISEINYQLADPQNAQLQALSLLSQGIFIRDVSVSLAGITSNLFQAFSDVVSDLLGQEEDKLKMGLNYLQGDKSQILDFTTADRLGLSLSTQITDRILIEGNLGVPIGGIEQTFIIGDIRIDFILNQQGTLRARIFNRENELRYIGDELGYTQGIGLSYTVDFETFGNLVQKIVSSQ
ncbi:MAG: translocation/assembly module TamB [Flavobacteriaceae bacterium]|nr:translocation/assembly module TamB [Flavobacteriaceae bacterium]MCY4266300.1 translocation/assembly module TamB [Flavobacteriaceae bacterium]